MTRFFSILALLGLTSIIAVNDASAKAPKGGSGNGSSNMSKPNNSASNKTVSNYKYTKGQQFKYGYFYKGSMHHHWTSWYWNTSFGCYFYYCPSACCYYYWYAPASCYYPCSSLEEFPPVAVNYQPLPGVAPVPTTTVQVNTPVQVTNSNQNSQAETAPVGLPKAP